MGSFFTFILCVILSCMFTLHMADDLIESVDSAQFASVHVIASLILLSNVNGRSKMFEFINTIDSLIEKRK